MTDAKYTLDLVNTDGVNEKGVDGQDSISAEIHVLRVR